MPLSKEELMKDRYKVIADYPKSLYHVGDILNGGWRSEDCIYCDTEGPRWRHYPHLFQKLPWYAERKIEEMPTHVKYEHNGKWIVFEVYKYEEAKDKSNVFIAYTKDYGLGCVTFNEHDIPSTQTEYDHFLKNKS